MKGTISKYLVFSVMRFIDMRRKIGWLSCERSFRHNYCEHIRGRHS